MRHPGLDLDLVLSDGMQDLLHREADVAVRMTAPRHAALVTKRVGRIAVGLHAHRTYLDRAGTPRTMEDLRSHSLIGYDRETPFIRSVQAAGFSLRRTDFALRCDSNLAQWAAIRAGFGIGFCQMGLARREPDLVRLLPDLEFDLDTFVAMHENLRGTPRCRAVLDALVETMAGYVADQVRVSCRTSPR